MKRLIFKRWLKLSACLVIFPLVVRALSAECHPVWRELHWGRIRAGQDVEEVIAATNPVRVERYGDYVRLSYQQRPGLCFTGIAIMAKNGRVASAGAGSCTWDRVFFDELTEQDYEACSEAYETHWRPIREKRAEAERAAADQQGE